MRNSKADLGLSPRGFAREVMQYVDMEVNGVPLKAFVNIGSEFTIISKSCAAWCGLVGLIDQKYKGIPNGFDQSETLGRIHVAPIKIGSVFYPCSFLVLNSPSMDLLLLGLDVLIKHQCIIDLKNNVFQVCLGEVSIPFLQEKDAPQRCLEEERYLKELASGSKATGMMYVDMEINGEPLKAFVDNRAQSTIISKSCAERCGLLRLLDQRYKSISYGVGYPEILGRVHVAPIKVESVFYPCSFMVLDSLDMDCIFGLDMLSKQQCIINLKENIMRVGKEEVSVPLLQV